MTISIKTYADQGWRKENGGNDPLLTDPLFNPTAHEILNRISDNLIFFVHTGKCAGESISEGINTAFRGHCTIAHYHCYDANELIIELLELLSRLGREFKGKIAFVVLTRDPLKRWESSFNWDLYNLYLKEAIDPTHKYGHYRRVHDLAIGIALNERDAIELGRFGHMGMGLAWYIPMNIAHALTGFDTYIIRQERASLDFELFVKRFSHALGLNRKDIAIAQLRRLKHDFKRLYPKGSFGDLSFVSDKVLNCLREYLEEDLAVTDYVLREFAPD